MAFEPVPLQSLERGYLRVLRIRSALGWLIALAVATAVEAVLYWQANMLPGVVAGPIYYAYLKSELKRAELV